MRLFVQIFFSQLAQMEHAAAILLGQNQRWIKAGPHEADPASGSTKATVSLLPAINCFSSGGHKRGGFRIASHAPPVLLQGFGFTRTREEKKRLAAHAG